LLQAEELKLQNLSQIRKELTRFMMTYKFGLDEMNTKIKILQEEFQYIHDYNPIEHTKSRLKTPESILKKLSRKNLEPSFESIEKNIHDIAGIRIVCSFVSDIYKISEMIQNQKDVTVVTRKDYIKNPKPNGYQSLHLIIKIPVFLSNQVKDVFVEIQIRTVAMDFWASLEHKIFYKYNKNVPGYITKELKDTATVASELDCRMEKLHEEIKELKAEELKYELPINHDSSSQFPVGLLNSFVTKEGK
jgi:putative GTP pyrophosphokinase